MICYKDKTFCASASCKNECGRKITPEEVKHAKELGLPIAYGKFCEIQIKEIRKYPKELIEEAKAMYKQGYSIRVISEELLMSKHAVRYHCDENRKRMQLARTRAWQDKNKEKTRERQREYTRRWGLKPENKEKLRKYRNEYSKKWAAKPENKQKIKERSRLKFQTMKADPVQYGRYLEYQRKKYQTKKAKKHE